MSNEYKDWVRDNQEDSKYWISKYPFLEMKFDDEYSDEEHGCWLDCLPPGWVNRFGETMCLELMDALGDYAYKWKIVQMKEKFGEMRLYHSGVPHNIAAKVESIIDKYTEISYNTCVKCGSKAVRYSKGWVLPYCNKCM